MADAGRVSGCLKNEKPTRITYTHFCHGPRRRRNLGVVQDRFAKQSTAWGRCKGELGETGGTSRGRGTRKGVESSGITRASSRKKRCWCALASGSFRTFSSRLRDIPSPLLSLVACRSIWCISHRCCQPARGSSLSQSFRRPK